MKAPAATADCLLEPRVARWRSSLDHELGPTILEALGDDEVVEILLNADGRLWLDHCRRGLVVTGTRFEPEQAMSLVSSIAGLSDETLTEASPILETVLPFGDSRIEILIPPLTTAAVFAIRKRARRIYSLAQYVQAGTLRASHAATIREAVDRRLNIVVSGGPGSGKTTLANAVLAEMVARAGATERFVLIEDTSELQCDAPNCLPLRTTAQVPLRRLVQASLRLRPDRLIVGEVRGGEALDLLKAWNTGRPGGVCTVHANNAELALDRLDHLAQEAGVPSQRPLIGNTVQLVVHIERISGSIRTVPHLAHVSGYDSKADAYRVALDPQEAAS